MPEPKTAEQRIQEVLENFEPTRYTHDDVIRALASACRAYARQQVEAWRDSISAHAFAGVIVRALTDVYGDTEDTRVDDEDVEAAELVLAWLRALPVVRTALIVAVPSSPSELLRRALPVEPA